MCALAADGESNIKNTELIMRGYSDFEYKLKKLGARILN
jgi:UDP-N-acetylglucosamine enolpyruvyl transferase